MRVLPASLLKFFLWFIAVAIFLFSAGCSRKMGVSIIVPDETYKLPRKVTGTSDKAMMAMLLIKLKKCGVTVVTVGQDYLISIPSSLLFPDQSPRLTWQSYNVLNHVVAFMKQFRKVAVNVTSYSSKSVSVRREHALTEARARAVADYLWSQGIDSRFIFTEGAGTEKPISANLSAGDYGINSRIEITFRDTIV